MALSRDSANERIWKLMRRTQFRFKQGVERIKWEEKVLYPEIEALKSGKVIPEIPEGVFDVEIIDESPLPLTEGHPRQHDAADATADRGPDPSPADS